MGLIYNATTDKVEYLIDLEGGSSGPITIDFAYMQDTEPSNPQEKDVWFDTTNNKIYTYKDGQWTDPKDPRVGVFYLYNDEYYLWDGNSLEKTDLNIYEKIENKTDNFIEDSSVKYPSSKALSDGLKSVEPNLYDIKTLSQAIIDKGWAYLCNSTKQMLPKNKIPTVYEDIEQKYLYSDKQPSSDFQLLINISANNMLDMDDTYLYSTTTTDWFLKRTRIDNLPTTNWEVVINSQVQANGQYNRLCVGEKIIIGCFRGSNNATETRIYKKSDMSLLKTYQTPYNSEFTGLCFCDRIWVNGTMKFVVGYKDVEHTVNKCKLAIVEDNDTLTTTEYEIPYRYFGVPTYINGYYVFMVKIGDGNSAHYYVRTQDFQVFTTSSYTWSNYDSCSAVQKIGDKLLSISKRVSSDNGVTWDSTSSIPDNLNMDNACRKENGIYSISRSGNYRIMYTENINSFDIIYSSSTQKNYVYVNDSADMFFYAKNYEIYFLGYEKVAYTDTYTINGSTVNIQYYKYEDWKICISDGGTNDTNLDTVYNGLGYENYWLLDLTNEQLCLPRNSNLYTQMYVGDDYEDITTPSGNYIPFALKPLKITNISASNWVADNTYADYGYKCDLSCPGVTANMFAQVIFGPTEADSGNYATVCQTGSGTVTIYSKVNDTITIPSIVVMGV